MFIRGNLGNSKEKPTINGVSNVISRERDAETGQNMRKVLKTKA